MKGWIIIALALLLVVLLIVLLRTTSGLTSGASTCTACPIVPSQYYTDTTGCGIANCPTGTSSAGTSASVGVNSCRPPNCSGQTILNAAGNGCVSCSLPTGKGFASMLDCTLIDCPSGQFGMPGTVGCSACSKSDQAVPPGFILQAGANDCAISRCAVGTSPNATKTACVADYVAPPPADCTGYWNNSTTCNMPGVCGQRGFLIYTYVIPPGSGPCNIGSGTERRTRQCNDWPQAPPDGVYPCV